MHSVFRRVDLERFAVAVVFCDLHDYTSLPYCAASYVTVRVCVRKFACSGRYGVGKLVNILPVTRPDLFSWPGYESSRPNPTLSISSVWIGAKLSFSVLTLPVRRQEGHPRSVKNWVLVCWWWRFDWSFALFARCMRQTDVRRQTASLLNAPA